MVNCWNSYCIDQQEEIERWLVFQTSVTSKCCSFQVCGISYNGIGEERAVVTIICDGVKLFSQQVIFEEVNVEGGLSNCRC